MLPNLGTGGFVKQPRRPDGASGVGVPTEASEVIHKAVRSISAPSSAPIKTVYGRNDKVVITNGKERREMKFKKAEPLLASGEWQIATD